ncbi:uncharacterized protein [Procambarus clarkii]|uniref:uncharacterized protein n=1 Tax=Procambarus clarkii TaxID=6728 RepID=UPI003742EB3B
MMKAAVTVGATTAVAALLVSVVAGEAAEDWYSGIPEQWEHRYHQAVAGDLVVREYVLQEVHPRTALLCPKDFAIAKLRLLLRTGEDIIRAHPEAALDVPYAHWLVKVEDGVDSDEEKGSSKCPTLKACLGYQACFFNYGVEFCHMDPIPGQRKVLQVTVTCLRDKTMKAALVKAREAAGHIRKICRRAHQVVHLTYTSRLEQGVQDYRLTEIRPREEAEEEVFYGSCPALPYTLREGYRGQCNNSPPDSTTVSEALWSLLGRVPSRECREEIRQIYCSFLYHNKGLCLPPFVLEPGQVSEVEPEHLRLVFNSFPQTGTRPDLAGYQDLRRDPHKALIPARIGFLILAHKDPAALVQLLSMLYRPHHYYVFHVDRRQAAVRATLTALLHNLMPTATNVRIVPESRSFGATWGSFNIVRAELEAFEELLRMGVWDFAVKMSGSELPLRDVDDLSATLAPYRGYSFLPVFGQRNKDMNADQGLVLDVWHGCEGYVYNVTRAGGQPYPEEIPIHTGSQWAVMSRDLVDYSVTWSRRNSRLNRWHFHLQTSIVPDESYFPTVAMNSPYKNRILPLGFHWLRRFEGLNTIFLCRHMEDADFCGQGPGPIEEENLKEMLEASHRYFLARKFYTHDINHSTRKKIAEHVRTNYYQNLKRHLPAALLQQLTHLAFPLLQQQVAAHPHLAHLSLTPGAVLGLRVMPRLHLTNPCCSLPFERSFKSTQEFFYWVDFSLVEEVEGRVVGGARAGVAPRAACDCYPDGHLRALRYTTYHQDLAATPSTSSDEPKSALSINLPLPFAMPGVDTVFVELWFHAGERSLTPDCRKRTRPTGTPMEFRNLNITGVTGDPLDVIVQLVDPRGNVRCEEHKTEYWDKDHIFLNGDGEMVEMASFFPISCGVMEHGPWTVRVFQDGVEDARHYELPVVVLPGVQDMPLDPHQLERVDLLQGLWTVEQAALLPFNDYYGDSPKLPERNPSPPVYRPKSKDKKNGEVKEKTGEAKAHTKDTIHDPRSCGSLKEERHFGLHHYDSTRQQEACRLPAGGEGGADGTAA